MKAMKINILFQLKVININLELQKMVHGVRSVKRL